MEPDEPLSPILQLVAGERAKLIAEKEMAKASAKRALAENAYQIDKMAGIDARLDALRADEERYTAALVVVASPGDIEVRLEKKPHRPPEQREAVIRIAKRVLHEAGRRMRIGELYPLMVKDPDFPPGLPANHAGTWLSTDGKKFINNVKQRNRDDQGVGYGLNVWREGYPPAPKVAPPFTLDGPLNGQAAERVH